MNFDELRKAKWQEGRDERGLSPDDPFEGDAAAEIMAEMMDTANYAEQLLCEGRITECEARRVKVLAFEFYQWADQHRA